MNAHNIGNQLFHAQSEIPDPGSAGTITVTESLSVVNLVSAGAEARTLARPTKAGAIVTLHLRTDGGDVTVTPTGGYNEIGSTTIVFSEVGQFAMLQSLMTTAGVYFWRLISNSNIANNPLVVQGASVAAASEAHALNATFSDTEAEAALNALGVVINNVITRLEAAGIIAAN